MTPYSRDQQRSMSPNQSDQLEIMALHRRLGHAGKRTMGKVISMGLGGSVRASDLSDFECAACIKGKGMRLRSNNNNPNIKRANKPLERISVDIWGPGKVPSAEAAIYFATVADDYSRFLKIFL